MAVAAATVTDTRAGDREWATAGKVLAGLAAFSVVSRALEPAPAYVPVYSAPAGPPSVVYQPPAPTYYVPQQQYPAVQCAPPPVVTYYAPPTYYVPAPRCYVAPPVYYAPAPVVSIGFGFGYGGYGGGYGYGGYGHRHHRW